MCVITSIAELPLFPAGLSSKQACSNAVFKASISKPDTIKDNTMKSFCSDNQLLFVVHICRMLDLRSELPDSERLFLLWTSSKLSLFLAFFHISMVCTCYSLSPMSERGLDSSELQGVWSPIPISGHQPSPWNLCHSPNLWYFPPGHLQEKTINHNSPIHAGPHCIGCLLGLLKHEQTCLLTSYWLS